MRRFVRCGLQLGLIVAFAAQLVGFAQVFHPFFDALAHFRFHLNVVIAIGCLLLAFFDSWRMASLGGAIAIASVLAMMPSLPEVQASVIETSDSELTLVQFNAMFSNASPELIVEQVRQAKADAVTLQEVSQLTRVIMTMLEKDYPSQIVCPFDRAGGVAVLSKHKALKQGCVKGSGLAWMEIERGASRATIASIHLHWPYPYGQSHQIQILQPTLKALPAPIIVGGDFAAAPWSHAVARVARATGTKVASGFRLTFKSAPDGYQAWPILPIDHILVPVDASAEVTIGRNAGSDHLPLIARIDLEPADDYLSNVTRPSQIVRAGLMLLTSSAGVRSMSLSRTMISAR